MRAFSLNAVIVVFLINCHFCFLIGSEVEIRALDGHIEHCEDIASAVRLASKMKGAVINLRRRVYHEPLSLINVSGITVEGNGAIIDGCKIVDVDKWDCMGDGLYRRAGWDVPRLSDPGVSRRFFVVFDGIVQRMGRCSKGALSLVPFKDHRFLKPSEWTYEAGGDFLYVKVMKGTVVEFPVLTNGVTIAGICSDIEIKNLTISRVCNDGVNVHGRSESISFRDIVCRECGDDGVSVHDECRVSFSNLLSEFNSTGITDTGNSSTFYDGVKIRNVIGIDIFFIGSGLHEITRGIVESDALISLRLDGDVRLRLNDVFLRRRLGPGIIRVSEKSILDMRGCSIN